MTNYGDMEYRISDLKKIISSKMTEQLDFSKELNEMTELSLSLEKRKVSNKKAGDKRRGKKLVTVGSFKPICSDCDKPITYGSVRCLSCHKKFLSNNKEKRKAREIKILSEYKGRKFYKVSTKDDLMDKKSRYYRG